MQIVLPSEYETKAMVLPNPARDRDPDWCEAGFGLDTNNVCTSCKPGSSRKKAPYSTAGISSVQQICNACAIAEFQPETGKVACLPCPLNTITLEIGARDLKNCTCRPGYSNFEKQNGIECSVCPPGAICPGGNSTITAAEGFWVHEMSEAIQGKEGNQTLIETISCNPASACINNGTQKCGTGWGIKYAVCVEPTTKLEIEGTSSCLESAPSV